MRREDRKNHVDKVAAALILQQWLDEQGAKEREGAASAPEKEE